MIFEKIANNPNSNYKIVTVGHERERLAIQELFNLGEVADNINFITIPVLVFNSLDNKYFRNIQNVKSRIYSKKDKPKI